MNSLATCGAREGHETQNGADVKDGTISLASRCSALLVSILTRSIVYDVFV